MVKLSSLHTNMQKHGFTVQQQKNSIKGSISNAPRPEPEAVPSGQTTLSTTLHPTDSSSLEETQPPASSDGPPAPQADCSGADSAATVADDELSAGDEVLSTPDSPHKEFHSAVVRALIKNPPDVEAAERGWAAGTPDETETSQKSSGLPLPSLLIPGLSYYLPPHWESGNPCLLFPILSLRDWSLLLLLFHRVQALSFPAFHLRRLCLVVLGPFYSPECPSLMS